MSVVNCGHLQAPIHFFKYFITDRYIAWLGLPKYLCIVEWKWRKRKLSNEKVNKYTLWIYMFYCVNQANVITGIIEDIIKHLDHNCCYWGITQETLCGLDGKCQTCVRKVFFKYNCFLCCSVWAYFTCFLNMNCRKKTSSVSSFQFSLFLSHRRMSSREVSLLPNSCSS